MFSSSNNNPDGPSKCPYCSKMMVVVLPCDSSMGEPSPQPLECLVDVALWFIPECPQFLR